MFTKGLGLTVHRRADGVDTTAGGISSRCTRLTLVGTIDENHVFRPSPSLGLYARPSVDAPAVALAYHMGTAHLVPVDEDGAPIAGQWHMAGGNYATGDSRVSDYYVQLGLWPIYGAIPIHDRIERY